MNLSSRTNQRNMTSTSNGGSSNATSQKRRLATQRPPCRAKSKNTDKNDKTTSSSPSTSSWVSWSKKNHKTKMHQLRRNDLLMEQLYEELKAAESECFDSLECFNESDSYFDSLESFAINDS